MKPLLVLLAGAALAAGPSAQAWAHPGAAGDGGSIARSGPLGPVTPARAGAAPARRATLPAPPPPEIALRAARSPASRVRAVILTIADGEQPEPATRSAFLNCAPVGGSHPAPEKACAWLNRSGRDPGALRVNGTEPCTMIYAPVTVTASGIWDGKYFQFRRTFGNDCEKRSAAGELFDF
ncbi:SSI family serine proteinase inhibitor [Microbispora sp. H13382]|uniref:SSI family serine proteinase inhibitor n=1 Tax=Microbispora sp. H13382 TaxID=2729112 RepID=UPI0015FEED9D|nr:SSI family serine proteinase inhibitor [Microbispora sp. H13382]